ncbi:hypothetical protein [Actinomadura madurae]|uniref:hypothetical protein n=1 Tax=Actinomadura madurae TaxID=1993 RepID=UPI0020D25DD9|nr:hypothetical protein [Actinomadura madurae]MCQ0017532.1 hypothetical protein [Actinomadura madurae]
MAASDLTFRWPSPVTAQAGRAPFQHALSGTDIRHLPLTDLDLSCERLIVRRPGKRHVIYLDELTYRCASAWLRERHRRRQCPPPRIC